MPLLDPEGREQWQIAGRVGAIGIELGLSIALGFVAGDWLDGTFGTKPWLTWLGLALGLVAGGRSLYRLMRKTRADLDADRETDHDPPP